MFMKNTSKLVQCLVEIIHPRSYEEAIEDIAEDIRKPIVHDPIAAGLRLIKGNSELSVLHMDNCEKLYQSLAQFNVRPTAETLDKVVPVNDQQLGKIAEALSQFYSELEDDYEDEEDENDDGDEYDDDDDGDENDDADDDDDGETQTAESIREFNIMNMAM
ncbi:acidic leucine-rich nuclear phosphoprotein 32 family member B [Drosophila tropicalis]|uniref:acidic leucine-rich nuclear phosphoprotein 32 family member B n=1 Tax=Drosophila tropicalis TaxID=46794 RepID=UPI0035ABE4DC